MQGAKSFYDSGNEYWKGNRKSTISKRFLVGEISWSSVLKITMDDHGELALCRLQYKIAMLQTGCASLAEKVREFSECFKV